MNALAIDTCTESLGLALTAGGNLYVQVSREGLRHAQTLAPQIGDLLERAGVAARELDVVVAAAGPGSFTGLRIGLATARGIARAACCLSVGVPSLDAMAWHLRRYPGLVVPVIDARKRRLYAALYRAGRRQGPLLDIDPDSLADAVAADGPLLLTGPHARRLHARVSERLGDGWAEVDPEYALSRPNSLLEMGLHMVQTSETAPLEPIYLRPSEAETARPQQNPL